MKISEAIDILTEIRKEYGELEVIEGLRDNPDFEFSVKLKFGENGLLKAYCVTIE